MRLLSILRSLTAIVHQLMVEGEKDDIIRTREVGRVAEKFVRR